MINLKKKLHINLINMFNKNALSHYRIIIKIKSGSKNIAKTIKNSNQINIIHIVENLNIICAICSHKFLKYLIEFPEIEYISLDCEAHLCGNKTFSNKKSSSITNTTYGISLDGENISIGLIDSGIYPLDTFKKPTNRIASFQDLINNLSFPYDDSGHGSAMCSIIGGTFIYKNSIIKNSDKCKFHVIKAFDKFNKSYCSLIFKALDIMYENIKEIPINILCLPFEISEFNDFILNIFQGFFDKLSNENVIIVTPEGNNSSNYQSLKGLSLLNNCITVGSDDTKNVPQPVFNNKFTKPTLISISNDIEVPNIDTEYVSEKNNQYIYPQKIKKTFVKYYGTSCSCAYVCSLLSLVKQKNMYLNINDTLSLLRLCCNKIEDVENSIQGLGVINITKLLT